MLFILAIDPLKCILSLAAHLGILSHIRSRTTHCHISLYVDDAGIFVNPRKEDLCAISPILDCFEKASVLVTNITKT
jgi:hypothetical protein